MKKLKEKIAPLFNKLPNYLKSLTILLTIILIFSLFATMCILLGIYAFVIIIFLILWLLIHDAFYEDDDTYYGDKI